MPRGKPRIALAGGCALYTSLGSFAHTDAAGAVHLHFTGRAGGRSLSPGSYRLRAQARNSSGRPSNVLTIAFSVIR